MHTLQGFTHIFLLGGGNVHFVMTSVIFRFLGGNSQASPLSMKPCLNSTALKNSPQQKEQGEHLSKQLFVYVYTCKAS